MTNEEVIKELKEELKEVITWLAITINKEEMYERKERRKRAIEAALIALEETRWIPVSEKLPEKNGNYLVTVEANDGTASIKFQMVDHYGPKWLHDEKTRKVIAWMPLPESYNAESEE